MPCSARPQHDPGFSDHIIVALGDIEVSASNTGHRMVRGDEAVFKSGESFGLSPGASFFEVAIKTNHPRVESPPEIIPPEKTPCATTGTTISSSRRSSLRRTRERHSHSQRVVMQLNRTRLLQWPDGKPEVLVETFPDRVTFKPTGDSYGQEYW
jgi:hypothetical protein